MTYRKREKLGREAPQFFSFSIDEQDLNHQYNNFEFLKVQFEDFEFKNELKMSFNAYFSFNFKNAHEKGTFGTF